MFQRLPNSNLKKPVLEYSVYKLLKVGRHLVNYYWSRCFWNNTSAQEFNACLTEFFILLCIRV